MFLPDDPRFDEMIKLADAATGGGLTDHQRERWRLLVVDLLGRIREEHPEIPERRRELRAHARLDVTILAPEEMASVVTTTVGAGGISLAFHDHVPVGTLLDLSIKVEGRAKPLLARAQVAWSRQGELGAAFIDLFQNDREHLEGLAAKAILANAAAA